MDVPVLAMLLDGYSVSAVVLIMLCADACLDIPILTMLWVGYSRARWFQCTHGHESRTLWSSNKSV